MHVYDYYYFDIYLNWVEYFRFSKTRKKLFIVTLFILFIILFNWYVYLKVVKVERKKNMFTLSWTLDRYIHIVIFSFQFVNKLRKNKKKKASDFRGAALRLMMYDVYIDENIWIYSKNSLSSHNRIAKKHFFLLNRKN